MVVPLLARRARQRGGGNIFAAATAMALEHGSVNLGQGAPSFQMPDFAKKCAIRSVEQGNNQYTRPGGNPLLMETLSEFYRPYFGRRLDPLKEITSCNGAQEGIFNILATFCDPGDQVVCIEPYFDAYRKAAEMVGVETKGVPLRRSSESSRSASEFVLDMDELERCLSDDTKVLILNTPHNPTGKVFSRDELERITEVVRRHPRLIVLSDEVYEFMCFDGLAHERFALLPGMFERTISLFSAGKTFSCTGWRIGYCVGPEHLIEPIIQTQGIVSFCSPTNNQVAIAHAFQEGKELGYFEALAKRLQSKRDVLCEALDQAGLRTIVPSGGYFVMADTSRVPVSATKEQPRRDVAVNEWLTKEVGITGIPTSYFYSDCNRHLSDNVLRFSFCKTSDEIAAAAKALAKHQFKLR